MLAKKISKYKVHESYFFFFLDMKTIDFFKNVLQYVPLPNMSIL